MNRFRQNRYLWWLGLCVVLLDGGVLFAISQLLDWGGDRTAPAQSAADCPKDIDVDLGGKLFRLPLSNNLSIRLAGDNAKSVGVLRGEFVRNGKYSVLCKLALTGTPTAITSFGFRFNSRANEQLEFIKGDIEPSSIFLLRTNGSRYNPYVDALKASVGRMNPEEKSRAIRRIGNVTEVKCCGTSDTSFYVMPPADLVQLDEMATIMQCSKFENRGVCRAYGTFAGANLTYLFASPLKPVERFEALNNSVKALLERLEIK